VTTLLLDTSGYSYAGENQPDARQAVQSATRILIPVVVVGELFYGFQYGNRWQQNRTEFDRFVHSRRVSIVPIVEETAEQYATISTHLRRQGTPIPTNDIWIAAAALEHDARILTADRHFSRIPQVAVQLLSR